jgi:diguanylate cyclase (GGDEF)-like protein
MTERRCERGDILFREGDKGDEMYVVCEGSVGIYLTTEDSQEVMLSEIGAGSFFGEMSIIEQEPRSATCRALSEGRLLVLSADGFHTLTQKRPRIAMTVLRRMARITTERLGKTGALLSGMVRWGEDARRRAMTDEMTGVFNRRFYDEALDSYVRRADVEQKPLCLAMFDLDRFGGLNKEYGEEFCDGLILEAVRIFQDVFAGTDILVRYGGDEFAFLMPHCGADAAAAKCRRVNERFRQLRFDEHPELRLTCSMGLAAYPAHASDLASLKEKADQALYEAKEAGRDGTVVSRRA